MRTKILQYIKKHNSVRGKQLCTFLNISRQALNKHLTELIKQGKIIKEGKTRGAIYRYAKSKKQIVQRYNRLYLLTGLQEDIVFKEINMYLNLKRKASENVFNIIQYAFTEMLNNAIEHSRSKNCLVEFFADQHQYGFKIRDYGIGLFYSINTKSKLQKETDAIGELIKGKQTTMPKRHTGEGIFFTSKAADYINFKSHKTNLLFDNIKKDVFVEEKRFIRGTEVNFSISKNSRKKLTNIFNLYAPEEFDYRFEKTKVLVKLFQDEYISRSEARRLLSGLEKFKEIVLDFQGVKSIGQGFCDEIFRVFQKAHTEITIKIENLNPSLRPMLGHVIDNKT